MAMMEWSPAYSIKVKKFDDQHKKLVELLNQLHDAMRAGEGSAAQIAVLQSLVSYTGTHFKDEEQMLQTNGYPDFARHKGEHDKLVKQVLDLQNRIQSGSHIPTLSLLSFLKEWLITHIQGEDKKYGAFLNSKGIT